MTVDLSWLSQIAPTVASALGGPLAGLAVEAVSKALGVSSEDTQKILAEGKMSAEQIAQVKIAELELQKLEKQLGLNFEELAVKDRASAREMQAATKSWIPGFLAITVTLGFFGILTALMYGEVKKSDEILVMLGALQTAWTGIIGFYYGSSSGSQRKDEMIQQATAK
jgi:hypothetical protein